MEEKGEGAPRPAWGAAWEEVAWGVGCGADIQAKNRVSERQLGGFFKNGFGAPKHLVDPSGLC